jgi:hypothetical protein
MIGDLSTGIGRDAYDRIRRVNWSSLKEIARSPLHYRHRLEHGRPDTAAMRLGRCAHLATLEPQRFAAEVAVWTGGRRSGKDWDAFCEASAGRELLTESEAAYCHAIAGAVRADPIALRYLTGGDAEVTIQWSQRLPGAGALSVPCKARLDYRGPLAIADLKTTRDASPEAFGRQAWNLGAAGQLAWYADGYEAATGERLPCVLVAVETEPPHAVQVYRVPDAVLELGREQYRTLLGRLAICRVEDRWPGYAEEEMELTLPRWVMPAEDDDASGLGLDFDAAQEA